MIYNTQRSAYQVDEANKRVRRLSGIDDPTPRMGKDGEWRQYEEVVFVGLNSPLFIRWTQDAAPMPDSDGLLGIPMTITTDVLSTSEDLS